MGDCIAINDKKCRDGKNCFVFWFVSKYLNYQKR